MQSSGATSTDWSEVLARVETALNAAVAQIAAREQALAQTAPALDLPAPDWGCFEQKHATLAAVPGRAEAAIERLDADLSAGEDALRQWLARSEAARRQLAAWVGRAVG